MNASKKWLALVVALAASAAWTPRAAAQGIHVSYFTPQFYVDHVVFYDEAGTPIYYVDNTAYAVPTSYELYNELVDAFFSNPDAYYRWFEEVGHAHLHYRRPLAYSGYEPLYYLEYPIYYDERGLPVYYVDGVMHRVPAGYPRYSLFINHYRARRALYDAWYRAIGHHFR